MTNIAYYMRRVEELEKKVEKLIKEKVLLEEKNKRVGRCIHSNCRICDMKDYDYL